MSKKEEQINIVMPKDMQYQQKPNRRAIIRTSIGALGLLTGSTLAIFACSTPPPTTPLPTTPPTPSTSPPLVIVTVGSKLDPESELLGSMYILLLQKEGFSVKDRLKLGKTDEVFNALKAGTIDIYPEFLQAGLARVAIPTTHDPQQDFENVKNAFSEEFQMTWLKMAFSLNDAFCVVMLQTRANNLKITTLSNLASVMQQQSPPFKIAVAPDSENTLARLQEAYGITFSDQNILHRDIESVFTTVRQNEAQVGIVYSTHPFIVRDNFVRLRDDKGQLLVDSPSPLVRTEVLDMLPSIRVALDRLAPKLTTEVSTELQRQKLEGQSAKDVAQKWLKDQGLL
jgi:osmoprotectant transport system substrate-binding protein